MKGEMTTLAVDGKMSTKKYDRPIPLDDLQAAVGGHIEIVPYFTKHDGFEVVVFCNENGKLDGLPINMFATEFWYDQAPFMRGQDELVGSIAIISGDQAFMRSL